MAAPMSTAPRTIVIAGGGFAGVYTARYLRKYLPAGWRIILFSRENHFIFTPLLGDVVGSSINPMHVVWPIRQMARRVTCLTATLTGADLKEQYVVYRTPDGREARQHYDHLILACGSEVNLDIIPGMAAHGFPLKTMGDALVLRNHLIGQLEKAEVEPDPAQRRRLLSVIVVGGGFSGVEVAGEVADLLKGASKFYGSHKPGDVRVTLLEGRERILPELPESLSAFADKKMRQNGIDIRVKALAQSATEAGVRLKDGTEVEGSTVICTIGTTTSPFLRGLGLPMQYNRVKTEPDFRVPGVANVWGLGDAAAVPNAATQAISAPTGQVALRQAKFLAWNLAQTVRGSQTQPFAFKPLGMLASIGNYKAVGQVFGLRVSGFLGWFLWRGVYLSKMPTLARKIQIAFDWAWQLLFPRDIAQIDLRQTERLGRAHYEAGQFVFHKGDPGDKFYIIQKGRAGVYLDDAGRPITVLKSGEYFGEGALLRAATRSASIRAEEPLDVLMIGRDSFAQMVGHLDIFRGPLERSVHAARSSVRLLEAARNNPSLNAQHARDVMSHPVETLPVGLTLGEALTRSRAGGRGAYPVVDESVHIVGLCTRTDFYNAVQQLKPPQTPLADVMHRPVITVREGDTLTEALLMFLRHPIKRLVVVADDDSQRPVGMLTPFDILQTLPIQELQQLEEADQKESSSPAAAESVSGLTMN
jgi:NADH dehydrogenase